LKDQLAERSAKLVSAKYRKEEMLEAKKRAKQKRLERLKETDNSAGNSNANGNTAANTTNSNTVTSGSSNPAGNFADNTNSNNSANDANGNKTVSYGNDLNKVNAGGHGNVDGTITKDIKAARAQPPPLPRPMYEEVKRRSHLVAPNYFKEVFGKQAADKLVPVAHSQRALGNTSPGNLKANETVDKTSGTIELPATNYQHDQ
jgi:hypothetical protein